MKTFNLIDQPWIPVRWLSIGPSSKPPLVSLHDIFTHSAMIADLDCAPHERIALFRLLVCITHAALGAPEDEDDWGDFGDDLASTVPSYLSQKEIRPHFDLLGEAERFLQKKPKSTAPKDGYPLSKIGFELSSGNSPKLLDHWGEDDRPWTPPSAALALLCFQNFFVGGSMASKVKGNGPALKSLQMLLCGKNLHTTILQNCLDLKRIEETSGKLGKPVWETLADNNLLSRLAPTSCALWLSDDLSTIFIDQGHQYLEYDAYRDPFASEFLGNDDKRRLIRAKPDQGIWRDLHLLTNLSDKKGSRPPLTLRCFNARKEMGDTTRLWVGELIKAKDAKIQDCTESSFTVPHSMFSDAGNHLYSAGIEYAETISRFLYGAIKNYSTSLSHEKPPTVEGQKHFWHHLDQNHRVLIEMAANPQPGQAAFNTPGASDLWTLEVRQAATHAFKTVCPHHTPRQIQAHTAGVRTLHRALYPKPPSTKKPKTPKP